MYPKICKIIPILNMLLYVCLRIKAYRISINKHKIQQQLSLIPLSRVGYMDQMTP